MTRIAASLAIVALAFVFAPQIPTAAQSPQLPTVTPTTLGLGTILGDFPYFAGQLVRIPTARVRDVLSPRLFTIEPSTSPRSYIGDGARALVIVSNPSVEPKPGLVVEIIGRPWTFAGAQTGVSGSWLEDLDEGERKDFATRAVIGADIVRTPGRFDTGAVK
jgi:hypothetical protein